MTAQFVGYRVDKTDSPAVDIQQAGGAYQRLTFAAIVFLGAVGAIALLGFLALAVILAQVVALVLLGFAPVALIIGIFPGAGHAFFRSWLSKLATAVFIKALYSLVIAIVVAVSAALAASTDSLGFMFAFGLQTLFFWAIFLYRKQITGRLVSATTGAADGPQMPRTTVVQRGAHIAARPFSALVGVGRSRDDDTRQESALAGGRRHPRPRHERASRNGLARSRRRRGPRRQRPFAARPRRVERQRPRATRRRWVERQRPRGAPDERRSAAGERLDGTIYGRRSRRRHAGACRLGRAGRRGPRAAGPARARAEPAGVT